MSTSPEKIDDSSTVGLPSTETLFSRIDLDSPFPRVEEFMRSRRNNNRSVFAPSRSPIGYLVAGGEDRFTVHIRNPQSYPKPIVLSDELESMVSDISSTLGRSEQEVILAGINLVRLAIKARNSGRKLAIIEQNQPFVSEVIGFEV
jgi:hypothetical protein